MPTVIEASGRNNIAVDGLVLPKFFITALESNRFPENGKIPAALTCYRGGNHIVINIPDLLDTTPAFVFSFTSAAGVFIDIADNKLTDTKKPRIKIATSSGQGRPTGFYPGDRIRIDNDGSVFIVQKVNELTGNEIEIEIDKPGTTDDLAKIQNDSSILQLWNKDADILAHRNKIHALIF